MRRPTLNLENFSTSQLAASRPPTLRQKDEEELERIADVHSFWVKAKNRGEASPEAILDLKASKDRIKILVGYAVVQLVRVSLRADYGSEGLRRGPFNEAKIYTSADYAAALVGGLKIARKCNWKPHILAAAPDREPPPEPFERPKRGGEPLSRIRRASSASSNSSSLLSLEKITELPEDHTLQPVCDQRPSEAPEQVFADD